MHIRRSLMGALTLGLAAVGLAAEPRRVISLDGGWEIAEGAMGPAPTAYAHRVAVPGLVDMAEPAFAEVGKKSARRQAFWYRRSFQVDGPVPAVAILRIAKAGYGSRVFLNGKLLGDHPASFTAGTFDAHAALRGGGETNELVVRVGAFRDAVPESIPAGFDFEKSRYIPGIFDSVELILSGTPHIVRVQTVPDLAAKAVRIQAVVRNAGEPTEARVRVEVRAVKGGEKAGSGESTPVQLGRDEEKTVDFSVPIPGCHLWSPENPFLYELEASTGADSLRTRFGMRTFRLDQPTGRAILNGKPYALLGSNICIYRFFEDPQRGDKPWREDWVRRLHKQFRAMNWNSLRYCIGFPPEMWYRIADEEGILIQDEFPIWHGGQWPAALKAEELIPEYTDWMQERWNHPCVVIWDAQNESVTAETGKAIAAVRGLDLSNRPWDNGWSKPQSPSDVYESHPYLFGNPHFKLANLARGPKNPGGNPVPNTGKNPIIINEYDWLWLNRDGTATTLSREAYKALLGADATPAQRRLLYARTMAALTEYWRSLRVCAGVLEFCALGYSRPDGQTSDHFTDIEKLTFEPEFQKYVSDAFAPTGVLLDEWAEELPGGALHDFRVVVTNDLDRPVTGTVRFQITHEGKAAFEKEQPCEVETLGQKRIAFAAPIPSEAGKYLAITELRCKDSAPVRSLRDFEVITPEERERRNGIAVGRPAKASSSITKDGATSVADAVDGRTDTRWSSDFSDPQWLAVDLGKVETIDRVELLWEAAYAKAFSIDTSVDGQTWKEVYKTDRGDGRPSEIRFPPTPARWVRFTGTQRGTQFGYSLWEFRVFRAK